MFANASTKPNDHDTNTTSTTKATIMNLSVDVLARIAAFVSRGRFVSRGGHAPLAVVDYQVLCDPRQALSLKSMRQTCKLFRKAAKMAMGGLLLTNSRKMDKNTCTGILEKMYGVQVLVMENEIVFDLMKVFEEGHLGFLKKIVMNLRREYAIDAVAEVLDEAKNTLKHVELSIFGEDDIELFNFKIITLAGVELDDKCETYLKIGNIVSEEIEDFGIPYIHVCDLGRMHSLVSVEMDHVGPTCGINNWCRLPKLRKVILQSVAATKDNLIELAKQSKSLQHYCVEECVDLDTIHECTHITGSLQDFRKGTMHIRSCNRESAESN